MIFSNIFLKNGTRVFSYWQHLFIIAPSYVELVFKYLILEYGMNFSNESFDKSIHHSNNVTTCPSNNYSINLHTFDCMGVLHMQASSMVKEILIHQ
jgi:hypothetical protein